MTTQERQVLRRFKEILTDVLKDRAVVVRLFGSKARGDDREDSDLDVLVIVSGDAWQIADEVYKVATDLLLETGICLSPKVLSRRQFGRLTKDQSEVQVFCGVSGARKRLMGLDCGAAVAA